MKHYLPLFLLFFVCSASPAAAQYECTSEYRLSNDTVLSFDNTRNVILTTPDTSFIWLPSFKNEKFLCFYNLREWLCIVGEQYIYFSPKRNREFFAVYEIERFKFLYENRKSRTILELY